MATTKREELVAKYTIAQAKIKELEDKKYEYKVKRSCDPFGQIAYMNIDDVVRAHAAIHDSERAINESINTLGITDADLADHDTKRLFLGYSVEDWDADFKMRVEQIHDTAALKKYNKVAELYSKHFTEDDKFDLDMSEAESLGINLD